MTSFHTSKPWQKLAKEFKTPRCVDCGTTNDLQAGHVLSASKWPMARLWRSNLINQCGPCNIKLGAKIHWSLKAIKLLVIYGMIKLIKYLITAAVMLTLSAYVYYDVTKNGSTITHQIQSDLIKLKELL
jgi:hypothetical protein